MGHIGLTPQSVKRMGGYKIQGRNSEDAFKLIRSARDLSDAGVFAIVLEGIPEELAAIITENISVPTIGIGAGRYCDGQVLVINDMLGLDENFQPKHAKKYADLSKIIIKAATEYKDDIDKGIFPDESHIVHLEKGIVDKIRKDLALD